MQNRPPRRPLNAKFLSWCSIFILFFSGFQPPAPGRGAESSLDPWLEAHLASAGPVELLPVIVILKDPPGGPPAGASPEQVIRSLQARARAAQAPLRQDLQAGRLPGQTARLTPFWIVNGFSLQASPAAIQALAARPEVAHILVDESFPAPSSETGGTAGPWDNLSKINAPQLWALGFRGQGVVVANLDTGVDATHPDLASGWRGGTNSWYDPYGKHDLPADLPASCGASRGHGTGTMGVLAGKTTGVAPDAAWIAAKIFDDDCQATTTAITLALEWLLDPDGDPTTPDAPQVVNNSWGGSRGACGLEAPGQYVFQPALQNLRAAGILPVFSAGNYGPNPGGGSYPANYPEAFAVGATDSLDVIYARSSRGPNECAVPPVIYPALAAPGVEIRTTGPGGGYQVLSGTSLAAPHAAGALALLLSALPQGLPLEFQPAALLNSALDLGAPGPDNNYGAGRLDVLAAYQWAASHPYPLQLSWAPAPAAIAEAGGTLSVTVSLNQAAAAPVQVYLSASAPGLSLPGPLTFAPGQTVQTVQFTALDNPLPEADRTLQVRLTRPQGAVLADPAQVLALTILDDDLQAGFAAAAQAASEAAGTLQISVIRSGGASFPCSLNYAAAGGTAAAGTDYVLESGTLNFAAGETQKTFPLSLLADGLPGPDKTLILALSSPIPAGLLLSPASTTLTIHNADPWQVFMPLVGISALK